MSDSIAVPEAGETIRIAYVPRPGLVRMVIVNALLSLVTFSIYRFWAKTNVRRHIWSCVHINGEPLEYTGKGKELFLGAIIVFALFGLPAALLITYISIALGPEHPALAGVQMVLFFLASLLWGAAIFLARRYQLSRTQWRGIRGGLEGSAVGYTLLYFGSILVRGMSLGWSTPALNTALQEHMIRATRFGSLPFKFRGRAGPLYPSYAASWFLTAVIYIALAVIVPLTVGAYFSEEIDKFFKDIGSETPQALSNGAAAALGVAALFGVALVAYALYQAIWSIYTAREMETFAHYTSAGGAEFDMRVKAGEVLRLVVGNFFITVLTLGIGRAFAQQRIIRFYCDRLRVLGTIDVDAVRQSSAKLSKTGEGLAAAFDVGGL